MLVARFFAAELAGDFVQNKIPLPIGMSTSGRQSDTVPPMLAAALTKAGADGAPAYPRGIEKLNDTADPVALMRNALTGNADQNAAIVLAGLPTNLLSLLSIPDGKDWAAKKAARVEHCRRTIRRGRRRSRDPGRCGRLPEAAGGVAHADCHGGRGAERCAAVSGWQPRRHCGLGAESSRGRRVPRVQSRCPTTRRRRRWRRCSTPSAPKTTTSRCLNPAPSTILDNGRTRFTPSPGGRHHYLIARPEQKERVLETYVKLITTQPPPPPQRGGEAAAAAAAAPPAQQQPPARGRGAAGVAPLLLLGAVATTLMLGVPARISGQGDEFDTRRAPGTDADVRAVSRASSVLRAA